MAQRILAPDLTACVASEGWDHEGWQVSRHHVSTRQDQWLLRVWICRS
ncbi:MAG: hypothetical protein ACF8CQ_15360 [Rhodopirellula sp. JB044]